MRIEATFRPNETDVTLCPDTVGERRILEALKPPKFTDGRSQTFEIREITEETPFYVGSPKLEGIIITIIDAPAVCNQKEYGEVAKARK